MIATRILKIHAEMAEIIEAKVGTCKIWLLCSKFPEFFKTYPKSHTFRISFVQ